MKNRMFGVCFLGLGAEGAAPAVATKRKVSDTSDNARVANFDIPVTSSPFKLRALGSTCPTFGLLFTTSHVRVKGPRLSASHGAV
jgi:hypothetical protein